MSRIDAALRRAGEEHVTRLQTDSEHLFVPAWSLEDVTGSHGEEAPLISSEPAAVAGDFSREWRERLVVGTQANGVLVEQFRRLAATLHQAQTTRGIHVIMVSSAVPGEGKTMTAVNLALVLSESYRRNVLLIDADLRRPSIGDVADVTGHPGLSEVLRASSEQKVNVIGLTPRLTLLPAGRPDPDPLGGLTSARMRRLIEEAASRFDWVILDAPPARPLADATILAQLTEGTLFVVRAGTTHFSLVQKGIEALGRERVLGIVLNGLRRMPEQPYHRYGNETPHRTAEGLTR